MRFEFFGTLRRAFPHSLPKNYDAKYEFASGEEGPLAFFFLTGRRCSSEETKKPASWVPLFVRLQYLHSSDPDPCLFAPPRPNAMSLQVEKKGVLFCAGSIGRRCSSEETKKPFGSGSQVLRFLAWTLPGIVPTTVRSFPRHHGPNPCE
uniref:Uncharacterized protein n=1 Tax=Steinernema glaseri TaxID=37863 RepID=A0A1I8A9E2_9BILA